MGYTTILALCMRESAWSSRSPPRSILGDGHEVGFIALSDRAVGHLVVPLGEVFGLVLLEVLDDFGPHFEGALWLGLVLQKLQTFDFC